ncbi:hypothetical protein BJ508DRAFT_331183 [Ascobolus immersus RN42]|uniref:Actin-like ATPase domain-containing protein n=1 Tax=Ascobolus immersus RN42 TaxID=1160509 RepID=A0A3N4HRE6_ASCIM|nr:hypothetical protein BJ508DRAFT_331183 [Ascobolus immersus RN42]
MTELKQQTPNEPVTNLPRRPQQQPRLSTTTSTTSPPRFERVDELSADIVNLLDPVSPLTSTPTSLRSFSSSLRRSISKARAPANTPTPHYPSHPAPPSTEHAPIATTTPPTITTMAPTSPEPEAQKYKPYRRSEVPSIPGGRVISPLGSPIPGRNSIGVRPQQINSLKAGLQGLGIQDSAKGGPLKDRPYGSVPNNRVSSSATTAVMRDDRIVVGIDFGTTHSAVAWAHTSTPDDYEVITQWPGQVGKDWGKVPSDISYHPVRNSTTEPSSSSGDKLLASGNISTARDGSPLTYKWGFEVSPNDANKISWVKVLLDPSQARPHFVNPKPAHLPYGKPPIEIVTDYLTALKNYTLLTLERRFGKDWLYGNESTNGSYFSDSPSKKVEFVLTVPAVWSDKAKTMTLEAAIKAGLGTYPVTGEDDGMPSSPLKTRPPSLPPIISSPPLSAAEFTPTLPSDALKRRSFTTSAPLRLITEPEGAAEYALRSISEVSAANLRENDVFIVLDAGGGTVDLISYRIAALSPKLQLDECAVGTGALCGAVYLDRRFEEFVVERIGKSVFDGMSMRAKQQMWGYWETFVKREFRGVEGEFTTVTADGVSSTTPSVEEGGVKVADSGVSEISHEDGDEYGEGEDFFVPLPGVPDNVAIGLQESFLRLSRKDVSSIFEPVVERVLELLRGQILAVLKAEGNNTVSCILLVGGFGSSEYLYKRIQKFLRQSPNTPNGHGIQQADPTFADSSGKIQVIQPRNAWTAVVRGAIIRGLMSTSALSDGSTPGKKDSVAFEKGAVRNRLSRRWYGVSHDVKYEEGRFDESEKRWHELRCEWVVRDRLKWYIKKGQATTSDMTMSFPFYRTIPVRPVQKVPDPASPPSAQPPIPPTPTHQILKTELWTCDLDVAPNKRDNTVHKLAVMTSEPIPVERFQKSRNEKGEEFYRVDYTLDMTVLSGNVVYEMRLQNTVDSKGLRGDKGVRVGSVQVRYEGK